ncbi:MAG TPA: PAS domain-containing protein, partial [Alphaproteobacteria bacterium]|nr:PAS domain-containing protein [Alphaproteobacteria bacterium]
MTATPSPLLTDPAALTRLALSAAPVFVYACDRELRYTWIDKANADALPGWPIGRRDDEIMAPDSAARLMAFKREVIETGQVLRREIAIECGDRAGHYAVTAQPVRDAEGSVVGLVATAVDVTERVRAEEELRESEERLRLALETARLGAWVRDLRTGELTCTAQCKANFGRGPAERLSYEDIAEATLEEDRLRTAPAAREAVMSRGEYNVEYRIRWPDGSLHWIASRGRAFYAPDGTPLRMIGVSLDVTERKRFEAEQRQQAEELERRVAERTRQLLAETEGRRQAEAALF